MERISTAFVKKFFNCGIYSSVTLQHSPSKDSWVIYLQSRIQPHTDGYIACTRGHVREFKKLQTAVDTVRAMGFQGMALEYLTDDLDTDKL